VIDATPHHIGCAVDRLEDSSAIYAGALGLTRRSRSFDLAGQHVRVCFVELGEGFYLELIAPLDEQARLARFFKVGFYHLCLLVDDLGAARAHLTARRFTELPAFASEAFAGNLCQFFVSPQSHLIELAQMSKKEFGAFFSANLAAPDTSA
jgi:catechol 2,3-dioxygenase-like lactoylglutathione lyase family enzyme